MTVREPKPKVMVQSAHLWSASPGRSPSARCIAVADRLSTKPAAAMLRYLLSVDRWRSTAGRRLKLQTVAASTNHRAVPPGRISIANDPAFQSNANAADATGNRLWG